MASVQSSAYPNFSDSVGGRSLIYTLQNDGASANPLVLTAISVAVLYQNYDNTLDILSDQARGRDELDVQLRLDLLSIMESMVIALRCCSSILCWWVSRPLLHRCCPGIVRYVVVLLQKVTAKLISYDKTQVL